MKTQSVRPVDPHGSAEMKRGRFHPLVEVFRVEQEPDEIQVGSRWAHGGGAVEIGAYRRQRQSKRPGSDCCLHRGEPPRGKFLQEAKIDGMSLPGTTLTESGISFGETLHGLEGHALGVTDTDDGRSDENYADEKDEMAS